MTVGFLINTCEPFYRGGYERRAWAFARELARKGHDVRIYTSCPRDEFVDGVHFVRLAAPRRYFNARGVRNGFADLIFAFSILRLLLKLRRGELDVLDVCATPFLHLPIAAFVTSRKGISLIITCHEALLSSLPDYLQERGHQGRFFRRVFEMILAGIYRFGMGVCSQRIAVSQRTAVGLRAEGFPARAVIEFGLEPEAFGPEPEATSREIRFIFCGRLTRIKAVDQALHALISICPEGLPFHFDIIGEGSEEPYLKSIVDSADARNWVTFHGTVTEQKKRQLLSKAEVFILSSPREGFSIATLEAMAQGCCAVVISDPLRPNGALDFVRDNETGICVVPGLAPLHKALHDLLRDDAFRLRLRRAAWKQAGEYRIEVQSERLVAYYSGLCA